MKILFNAAASSVHTVRWVNAMAELGHVVWLHTLTEPVIPVHPAVRVCKNVIPGPLGYFIGHWYFKRVLREFRPDLIHSMHSGNHAMFTRNINDTPVLLSTWGGDIHVWPYRNAITRYLTLSNLRMHRFQSATSQTMARDMKSLRGTDYPVEIIPYGVDLKMFSLKTTEQKGFNIRLGAMKNLIPDSGLDLLIQVYSMLVNDPELSDYNLSLHIAGSGSAEMELKNLVTQLNLGVSVSFLGQMPHSDVPGFMKSLDIFCSLSRRESFGVSIAEASATGLPVVATDIQGIPEIVQHDVTGYLVPPNDLSAAADAMKKLILDSSLRERMGCAGRDQITDKYEWADCVSRMEALYKRIISLWVFLFFTLLSATAQPLSIHSIELNSYWNSNRPSGQNDGWVWQGRGGTTEGGVTVVSNVPIVKINLRPSFKATQNTNFVQSGREKRSIDIPERLYKREDMRFAFINSSIFLDFWNIKAGISNENRWWGPGVRNSIILSNHAEGFDHARVQTSNPQYIGIGGLHLEYIMGRLIGSEMHPERYPDGWRLFTGLQVGFYPSFIPGLKLGLNRTFIANQRDVNTVADYFPLFQAFQKSSLGEGTDGSGSAPDDQRVSVFFDWKFKESGFRTYAEFGREDHSMDVRDIVNEPSHARAYILGVEKRDGRQSVNVEFTQMQVNTSTIGRSQGIWYTHSRVNRGYTNRGEVLGSGVGPGGTSLFIKYERDEQRRRMSVYVERAEREVEFARRVYGPAAPKEVDYIVGVNLAQSFKNLELVPEFEFMNTRNRFYLRGNVVNNVALRLKVKYQVR